MASSFGHRITSDSMVFHLDFANRRCFAPNILNYSHWTVGSGGVAADATRYGVTNYDRNGEVSENFRVIGTDPFGYASSVIWRGTSVDGTLPGSPLTEGDGGWNSGQFAIDNTKLYRFSVWTRRDSMDFGPTQAGSFYLGTRSRTSTGGLTFSISKSNLAMTNNPYFHITPNPNTSNASSVSPPSLGGVNVWTLVVGHVWPVGTETNVTLPGTGINGLAPTVEHPDSGVWTVSAGKIGNLNVGDWVWYPVSAISNHRAYHYYSAPLVSTQSFIYPRVDVVDGFEPSVGELLTGPEPVRDLVGGNVLYARSITNFDKGLIAMKFDNTVNSTISGFVSKTFSVISASVWIKNDSEINSSSANGVAIQFGNPGSHVTPDGMLVLRLGGGQIFGGSLGLQHRTATSEKHYWINNIVIYSGVWFNICFVWNQSINGYDIYLNGQKLTVSVNESAVQPITSPLSYCDYVSLGSRNTSNTMEFPLNNVAIGSVVVYDRVLEADEVNNNFQALRTKYGGAVSNFGYQINNP